MLEKIMGFFKKSEEKVDKKDLQGLRGLLVNLVFTLFLSYFASSLVLSFVIQKLSPSGNKFASLDITGSLDEFSTEKVNYRDLQNNVLERNIFNNKKELPVEKDDEEEEELEVAAKGEMSLDGPCPKSSLQKQTLLGTIVFSAGGSYATVREKGIAVSDIYKVGDQIYGEEGVKVIGIRQNVLILNNSGRKECLYSSEFAETKGVEGKLDDSSYGTLEEAQGEKLEEQEGETRVVRLSSEWVQAQLGSGFTKIMQEISTPPDVVDGEIFGFKFFGITPNSLLGKIGLEDGDTIIEVNGRSTSESVFVFYQALGDETEILVGFERDDERRSVKVIIE